MCYSLCEVNAPTLLEDYVNLLEFSYLFSSTLNTTKCSVILISNNTCDQQQIILMQLKTNCNMTRACEWRKFFLFLMRESACTRPRTNFFKIGSQITNLENFHVWWFTYIHIHWYTALISSITPTIAFSQYGSLGLCQTRIGSWLNSLTIIQFYSSKNQNGRLSCLIDVPLNISFNQWSRKTRW